MSLHAFVDESVRGRYMLCAVLVPSHRVNEIRKLARQLRLPGQRRWHFVDESDRRRRMILDTIAREECIRTLLYVGRGDREVVRREGLTALVFDLADRKASRLMIESVEWQDATDRRCIAGALGKAGVELFYAHLKPYEEPGLWLPDAIAWAYGAGGHWRRRIEGTIEAVQDLGDCP